MTTELEQLVFGMDANITRLSKKMDEANGKVDRAARRMERRMAEAQRQIEQSMERAFGNPFDGLKNMAATLAAGLSTTAIIGMADAWTEMEGRAGQAIAEGENAGDVMARLSDMALRTYSSLEQTAEGFFRNSNTLKALGYSTDEALNYIEALNNALVVSGAKGQRAESIMNALSKAMASGKLDGDNLNTVIESGGRVAELLADNLGVSTLELAKMGKAGKITGDVLYNSLVGNLEDLRDEADSMAATVGDAIQNAATKLTQYVGEADKSLGATEKLAQAIELLSDNYDVLIPLVALLGSAVGVNMVQNLVRGQIAAYGLAGSFRVAGAAALGAFGGPVGLAITGVTVALGYLAVKQVEQSQNLKNLKEKVEDYRTEQE
ncbi:MAG: tape measure protein, partial [Asticcacaulis sp.]